MNPVIMTPKQLVEAEKQARDYMKLDLGPKAKRRAQGHWVPYLLQVIDKERQRADEEVRTRERHPLAGTIAGHLERIAELERQLDPRSMQKASEGARVSVDRSTMQQWSERIAALEAERDTAGKRADVAEGMAKDLREEKAQVEREVTELKIKCYKEHKRGNDYRARNERQIKTMQNMSKRMVKMDRAIKNCGPNTRCKQQGAHTE